MFPKTGGVTVTLGVLMLLCLSILSCVAEDNSSIRMRMSSLPCKLEILPFSAAYFADWVTNLDANLAHLRLDFLNISGFKPHINHTSEVVFPGRIIWTYTSTKSSFRYTKWPIDFNILSMGLLNGYTLTNEVKLYLNVTPLNCEMVLGTRNTSEIISDAFLDFTETYFKSDRKHSIWCYYSEIEGFKNSTTYHVGRYFVFPGMGVGYKCCKLRKNLQTAKFYYQCNNYVSTYSTGSVMFPYIFGVLLFAYFPILLMRFADIMETYDHPTKPRHSEGYEALGTSVSDVDGEEYNGTFNDKMRWTFLCSNGPVSFSTYVFTFCTLSKHFPVLASKLRRLLFVFFSPVIIYIKLIVYHQYFSEFIRAFLDRQLPVGFLSMLGGVHESGRNFLPYLGGPFVALLLYFFLGSLLLVVPKKLSFHLEKALPSSENKNPSSTLLQLDMKTIEQLSMLNVSQLKGYAKIYTVIQAKLYMVVNPQTWYWFICRQKERWRLCVSDTYFNFHGFTRFPLVAIKVFGLFLYICLCIVELLLIFYVHSFPVVNFLLLSVKAYSTAISDAVKNRQKPYQILLGILCTLFLCFFIFAFSLICIDSLTFVGKVCIYVYLSILVYPSYSFAYIFFVGTTVYYITVIVRSFRETYFRLLRDIIEISVKMKQELETDRHAFIRNETLYVNMNLSSVKHINLNGFTIPMERSEIHYLSLNETPNYVRYRNNCPGVPTQLFDQIVRHRKPIYIDMSYALCQIVFICVLALVSLCLVSEHNKSADVGGVMHVISVLVVGTIPRAVQTLVSRSNRGVIQEEHTKYIKETVKTFWRLQWTENQ